MKKSFDSAEERDLVQRMREGDEKAFEAFADHYVPAVYRFAAAHLKSEREQIREVVQNTICKSIEKLDSWRGDASLFTWLCAMCRNEIAGYYRQQQRRPLVELDENFSDSIDPEQIAIETESGDLVHLVMDALPPSYAAALQWKYLDELSVAEIGTRLSLGPKAAESLLTRARRAFRSMYEELAQQKRGRVANAR